MHNYTVHKYIQIQDHEISLPTLKQTLLFPPKKVLKILLFANLALLLVNVIDITGEWDSTSPEQRTLSISNIVQIFPSHFVWSKDKTGVTEAKLLVDLRTQMFFQLFLESAEDGFQDWDTEAKIKEVLQIGTGGQLDQKKVQAKVSYISYLCFI
jgi:hypothetical protein